MRIVRKFCELLTLVVLLVVVVSCKPSTTTGTNAGLDVNEEFLRSIINTLTDDDYEGRLTGSHGNELAMDYVKAKFTEFGLSKVNNTYEQQYTQKVVKVNEYPVLEVYNGDNLIKKYDYIYDFGLATYFRDGKINGEAKATMVKYGEGSLDNKVALVPWNKYSDFKNYPMYFADAEVLIFQYQPIFNQSYPHFAVAPNVTATTSVNNNGFMTIFAHPDMYTELTNYADQGYSVRVALDCTLETVDTANIIGYVEGNREKDEYIIIGAHLDHVGKNGDESYNPGGFDNASGIAAMLEAARLVAQNRDKIQKTIVFIAFNGEEEGLYGSTYYSLHPLFPLNKTEVINLDMVGSDENMPLNLLICNSTGSRLRQDFIDENTNARYFTFAKEESGGCDHVPFCDLSVPAITLIQYDFDGYHSPTDTIDNVDIDKLSKIVELLLNYVM